MEVAVQTSVLKTLPEIEDSVIRELVKRPLGSPDSQIGPELELIRKGIGKVEEMMQSSHGGLMKEMVELRRLEQ